MNSQIPGWVWFFTGLVTGLFLALLIYLGRVPPVMPGERDPGVAGTPAEATGEAAEDDFPLTFYDRLPRNEVPVVEERLSDAEARAELSSYLLQTGSFAREEDADRMRAELLLMGLDAFTRRVSVQGEMRYRVLVGPLNDKGQLNHALDTLAEAEIESLALKVPQQSR